MTYQLGILLSIYPLFCFVIGYFELFVHIHTLKVKSVQRKKGVSIYVGQKINIKIILKCSFCKMVTKTTVLLLQIIVSEILNTISLGSIYYNFWLIFVFHYNGWLKFVRCFPYFK